MKLDDYDEKKYERSRVIATWLNLRDNKNEWERVRSYSEDNNRYITVNEYICKGYNISKRTLGRIINEFSEEHPELFLNAEQRAAYSKRYLEKISNKHICPAPPVEQASDWPDPDFEIALMELMENDTDIADFMEDE